MVQYRIQYQNGKKIQKLGYILYYQVYGEANTFTDREYKMKGNLMKGNLDISSKTAHKIGENICKSYI